LLQVRRQRLTTVLALCGENGPNLVDSFGGDQGPMRPAMTGLSTRLSSALLASAPGTRFACQSIGGRRFRGVRGVLFPYRQLALQLRDLLLGVRDLLLGVGDLLIPLGYLTQQFLKLSLQPLILTLELLPARLAGVPMAIRYWLLLRSAANSSRTHPPYGKRFLDICPVKSTRVPELLLKMNRANSGCRPRDSEGSVV